MKLSKIYCNQAFNTVLFNSGLNVILAEIKDPKNLDVDSHNLGKTTLITLIDFLLLDGADKNHLFKRRLDVFGEHAFFLELELNNGKYLTIRRAVSESTKISFKNHETRHQDFNKLLDEEWDELNLPIDRARNYLNLSLEFDVLNNWHYRKSINYFLRTQEDYSDVFRLNKFSSGKDIHWKPFMLDLLGFNGDLAEAKYDAEIVYADLIKQAEDLATNLSLDPDEIDKIIGINEVLKAERDKVGNKINEFDFYKEEKSLNREVVEEVEIEISELNSQKYNYSVEVDNIERSIEEKTTVKISHLEKLYEEAQIYLGKQIIKSYEDLIGFNKKITEERNTYLNERKLKLQKNIGAINARLLELNKKRSEMLSVLKDDDFFKKYKYFQDQLSEINADIKLNERKITGFDSIKDLNKKAEKIHSKITKLSLAIEEQQSSGNTIYSRIRQYFNNVTDQVLNSYGILHLNQNKSGNIDFNTYIRDKESKILTAEGEGHTYKQFMCEAFDLSVLTTYASNSFYRFVYHDGPIEGFDDRKAKRFIDLVTEVCEVNNVQYIFTAIENGLPRKEDDSFYKINQSNIAVSLDDSGIDGTLFKAKF